MKRTKQVFKRKPKQDKVVSNYELFEMETALPTYQCYMGMKLHFKLGSNYDWFKYGPQERLNVESLQKARGRYQIAKLHKKFSQLPEEYLIAHIAANFIHNPNMWFTELLKKDAFERTKEYKGQIENFTYMFQTFMRDSMLGYAEAKGLDFMGLVKAKTSHEHTWLMKAIIHEKLPLWFIVGLDRITSFISQYDMMYAYDMFWPQVSEHLKNVQGFYVFDHSTAGRWLITEIKRRGL